MVKLRKNIYLLLEDSQVFPLATAIFNKALIALILFNIGAATLETVPELSAKYETLFLWIEVVSISIFSFEYIARLWVSAENPKIKNRWHYVFTPGAIIDFVSIAPFYLSVIFGLDLKVLVVLRLLRLLKLIRYFEPLAILGQALKAEFRSFVSALFILFILIMVAATGMYFFERHIQPEHFGSIPQAMWWAVVTLTTLGYGDVIPATAIGKVFASMITILSIGTVALPAGMLASRFSEELKSRKEDFQSMAMQMQKDGHLCDQSRATLEAQRQNFCLTSEEAQDLMDYACAKGSGYCPHCGQKIGGNSNDKT